ncbi:actin-binding protein [Bdellovibrio sp. NC01]|uniref:actin-binding protein n=1 Tax=Bdellovibrio sp. NC01 TaxID=2220073 RepID=UPI00115B9950|nr:actin-binding protein [Bdellovibrio sp. NC01]QDK36730.1 actin-binding protein [Bdellovibrio sp. NC01]
MASTAFQKILNNLSSNKNVQSLLESFQTLSDEIKKREAELKGAFDQKKDEKLEQAWQKYQEIVKVLSVSEEKLEKEVNSTLSKIKKSADSLEKNIVVAKKRALAKKAELEKKIFSKQAKKKTTKKAAKKAPAKTTKKAVTKKAATTRKKTSKKA